MIIDCHTHCFPDHLATGALRKLQQSAGALKAWSDGTAGGILAALDRHGIDQAWVLNIATTPNRQQSVNDFAAAINSDRLIALGSVHPDAPDALDELERIAALGLCGIKLHPFFQKFAVDEPRHAPLYRKAAALGLITVLHAGLDIGFLDGAWATPQAIARSLPWFGGAPVVAAHLGGSFCWPDVRRHLVGLPVFFDTSFSCGHIPLPEAAWIVEHHGPERILFGSDLPWGDPEEELGFIRCLDLGQTAEAQILGQNAARLLLGADPASRTNPAEV
jgi:hypothetical protein